MVRQVYIDGAFVGEDEARISIFDRGLLFGDSIYEVSAVIAGRLLDNDSHLARLERSLREIDIEMPLPAERIREVQHELVARNRLDQGVVYLQVTRGAADRDFGYADDIRPCLFAFTQSKNITDSPSIRDGIRVATVPDMRWARRDIKTTMLLPQVLAKREAKARGCREAWLVEDGYVTEGASSSAFIVGPDGAIVTRPRSHAILPGCTRGILLDGAAAHGIAVVERPFTVEEALSAREVFLTSASSLVTPVIAIDDRPIGAGTPGAVTRRLQALYLELAQTSGKHQGHPPAQSIGGTT